MKAAAIPDFLVVGAAKAGTTSIHAYLAQHPNICVTRPKETFYFVWQELIKCNGVGHSYGGGVSFRSEESYRALFSGAPSEALRGEVCVAYLYFPEASKRIFTANRNCKIIIVLRNPVDRAFSNYLHAVHDGFEKLSFKRAIEETSRRLADNWWWGFDYIGASLYADQVDRYLTLFGQKNVQIFFFEDLVGQEEIFVNKILDTLGLPAISRLDSKPQRPGWPPARGKWRRALEHIGGNKISAALEALNVRRMRHLSPSLRQEIYEKVFRRGHQQT